MAPAVLRARQRDDPDGEAIVRIRSGSSRARCTATEFGGVAEGYFVGVPALLGKNGVEKIVDFAFEGDEAKLFAESVSHVKDLVKTVRTMFPELG